MDWYVLGIEPTKDKKAITAAYRQKLRQTNPEDKPEEFKALRAAYEQALALADQADEVSQRDESPLGLWMEKVAQLYGDFAARLDPVRWKALMDEDICVALDSRGAAQEALLKFLMEDYFLPREVWQVLDQTFEFSTRQEELYENWPREFIDHVVLAGIRLEPGLSYELFTPGINAEHCDTYRKLYFQANRTAPEEVGPILDQMEALSEEHPYGRCLRYRYFIDIGRVQEGKEGFRSIARQYPDHPALALAWADICMEDGDTEQAHQIADHILSLHPEHMGAKLICAKALAKKQDYTQAKELAHEILNASSDDPILSEQVVTLVRTWNQELIHQREARYAEDPTDTKNHIELCWCYAQNERIDEAMELALKIDPNYDDPFDYHNLMSKLYHNTGKFTQALEHLRIVEDVLRNMEDDGSAQTRKRLARLPEMIQFQGNCLMQMGRIDEAKERFEEALAIAPEDTEVLMLMGRMLYASGDFEYAVEIFSRLLRISSGAWFAELLMAICLYRLKRDREAFESVNRVLMMQSSDLSPYILKMQILIRNHVFDEVHEILTMLKESGAPEDLSIDFIQAELTELEQKNTKLALKQYRELEKRIQAGEAMLLTPELYHRLAILTSNQTDLGREENRKEVLELLDKGLEIDAQSPDLLSAKAWILKNSGDLEQAIAVYQTLEEKNPGSAVALRGIADLYYEDLTLYAAQALTYYEKLLQTQKTAELYYYAASCKQYLADAEGARYYYLKELEMDPEDIDGYRGLASLCDAQGDYSRSLELLDQALSIMEEYHIRHDGMVIHKAMVLRRMARWEEALAFAEECEKRYQYPDSLQLRFDICCQFGQWDRAEQVLNQWKQERPGDPKWMAARGRLHLLRGQLFRGAVAMGPAKHKLPFEQIQDFRLKLNDLEGLPKRKLPIWSRRARQNPEDDHAVLSLAHTYWQMGNLNAAKGAAQRALDLLDAMLKRNLTDEALLHSRRCLALAILGRVEEAKAELEQTRKLPLCSFCEYSSCKDADIYEAHIEEILGNREQAEKLYAAGREKWPDELDFAAGLARLKKKRR